MCITLFIFFFSLLVESCELNHCQDGIEVFFATETLSMASLFSKQTHTDFGGMESNIGWLDIWMFWDNQLDMHSIKKMYIVHLCYQNFIG